MASFSDDTLSLIKNLLEKQGTNFSLLPKPKRDDFRCTKLKSGHHVFEFLASWSVSDWYGDYNFGASRIGDLDSNGDYFPSLKVLGTGDFATVNRAFFGRFKQISADLRREVDKVLEKKKEKGKGKVPEIVFTGHSNGGAIAILATVWFLEQYRHSKVTPLCVSYGAPLVGDKIFGHAVRREQLLHEINKSWASCFINVVSIRDLAPRILLSPLKDLNKDYLESVFQTWEKKGKDTTLSTPANRELCEDFFTNLVNNAFAVASYDSCVLKSSAGGGSLLEAVKDLVELSPYRPFGSFHFCVGDGKTLLRVDNHDAVLQILFYSLQLHGEGIDVRQAVQGSVEEHLHYESRTKDLNLISLLDNLNQLPLSPQNNFNPAFEALGLSTEARLSLRGAGEMEAERLNNLKRVEGHKEVITKCLEKLKEYQAACSQGTGYYDAFKMQEHESDFNANVHRLELVGLWEEVRELLKVFELPDSFEVNPEWVALGTRIRVLMEPIDIANFYRHYKGDQTGQYQTQSRARPNYYKYPENWLQHMRRCREKEDPLRKEEWFNWTMDSCFWARLENMCQDKEKKGFQSIESVVTQFEKQVLEWLDSKQLDEAVLAQSPTFRKWWEMLPQSHKEKGEPEISRIALLINNGGPSAVN
ncbi:protein EDS1L-like [Nymphaea colorata]|nr:protein EDS1L-like [Nymphaea colorata]